MQNIEDSEEAATDREELQCLQMILHGEYTVEGEGVPEPYVISAGRRPSNNIVLFDTARLSLQDRKTFKIVRKIEEWAENCDGVVDVMALDKKGWSLVSSFDDFNHKLETRRGSNSEMETALKDLGKSVSFKGWLGDVAVYVVAQEYTDEKGQTQKSMPDNTMVLGYTQARGLLLYGAIQDLHAQKEGADEAPRYLKDWEEGNDPAVRYTMLQSAPGHYMADVNYFTVITLD